MLSLYISVHSPKKITLKEMKLSVVLFAVAAAEEGSGDKPQKHPMKRINKLESKFNTMLEMHFADRNPNWTERTQGRMSRIAGKIGNDFDRKNAECGLYQDPEEDDDVDVDGDEVEQR